MKVYVAHDRKAKGMRRNRKDMGGNEREKAKGSEKFIKKEERPSRRRKPLTIMERGERQIK